MLSPSHHQCFTLHLAPLVDFSSPKLQQMKVSVPPAQVFVKQQYVDLEGPSLWTPCVAPGDQAEANSRGSGDDATYFPLATL